MLKSFVLDKNKEIMVLNWIKSYQWDNKNIRESIEDSVNYYDKMNYVENDISKENIKVFIENYLNSFNKNNNVFESWLKNIYMTYPHKTRFEKFLNDNNIVFDSKEELKAFIINML